MSAPRLLVMEGNTAEGRALLSAAGGVAPSVGYARLLRELLPGTIVDICHPADAGANLPDRMGLEGYDGVAITGSALNVYKGGPAIERQIEMVRTVLAAGTPLFGSCWGLQVITVATGGSVRKNPKGREIGFARPIRLTAASPTRCIRARTRCSTPSPCTWTRWRRSLRACMCSPGTQSRKCRPLSYAATVPLPGACNTTRNIHWRTWRRPCAATASGWSRRRS